jgi:hypothetical protein
MAEALGPGGIGASIEGAVASIEGAVASIEGAGASRCGNGPVSGEFGNEFSGDICGDAGGAFGGEAGGWGGSMPGGYMFARKADKSLPDASEADPGAPPIEPVAAGATPTIPPAIPPGAALVNAGMIICSPHRGHVIGCPARPSATSKEARHNLHCSVTVIAYNPNPL